MHSLGCTSWPQRLLQPCTCRLLYSTSRDDCDFGEEDSLPSDSTALAMRMTVSSELTDDAMSAKVLHGDGHLTGFVTGMHADLTRLPPV